MIKLAIILIAILALFVNIIGFVCCCLSLISLREYEIDKINKNKDK